jgi:hypothetical protein
MLLMKSRTDFFQKLDGLSSRSRAMIATSLAIAMTNELAGGIPP